MDWASCRDCITKWNPILWRNSGQINGPTGVNKTHLIGAAAKVANDRIRGLLPVFTESGRASFDTIILSATVISLLEQPTIELRVQARYTADDAPKTFTLRIGEMGKSLNSLINTAGGGAAGWLPNQEYKPGIAVTFNGTDYICTGAHKSGIFEQDKKYGYWSTPAELGVELYDPQKWPVPLAYDSTTPAGIFACYLQHPCSVWHDMPGSLPPVTSGSDEVDEDNAKRPGYDESGYPDRPPMTLRNSPHVFEPDDDYLLPVKAKQSPTDQSERQTLQTI